MTSATEQSMLPPHMRLLGHRSPAWLAGWIAGLIALGVTTWTGMTATEDPLQQQSSKQEQIKAATSKVGSQLELILTEFEQNGIAGEDVKILHAIRGVIHRLTDEEMRQVLQMLAQARTTPEDGQSVSQAFSGQRSIITQLRQLLLEYQRQQAVYDIALRLKELAARQTDNMRLAVWLGRQVERKNLDQFQETHRLNLQLQETEEASLRAETSQVMDQLEKLVNSSTEAVTTERPRKALQRAKEAGMIPSLDSALKDLNTGRLLGAAGSEKRARDQMRELARILTQSVDKKDALREALRELDTAIEKQQTLTENTRKLLNQEDANKREGDQAEVVDSTDLIRRDIQDIAPSAAEHLQGATDRMQEARSSLLSGQQAQQTKEQAMAKQSEAMTKLDQARRDLVDQLNKAESPKELPEKALAAIEALQQKVKEMIKQQTDLRKESAELPSDKLAPIAPKQGDLKDQAQETQQQAASLAPSAAEALGEAGSQMQRSQKSLAEGKNQDSAQQAALEALARAERALAKEKEKLDAATKELADAEELLKKLIALIQDQQEVFATTSRAAQKPTPEPLPELTNQQTVLGERTRVLQEEAKKPSPPAAEHLEGASVFIDKAREELVRPAPAEAQPRQSSALKEMYAARRELERKINELKDQLGESSEENQDNLQDVSQIIAEAQKEVNDALSNLQQGAANAMQTLKEKQQQVVTDLGQPILNNPITAQARREADAAALKLGSADLPAAIEAMKSALNSIDRGIKANQPNASEGAPNLPGINDHQKEVLNLAQTLAEGIKKVSKESMEKAAKALGKAGKKIQPLSSGKMGQLPGSAQKEIEAAQEDLDGGSAEAGESKGGPARASAQRASQHLAQAQAAISLAQSGLSSDGQQPPNSSSGQGKKPGQGMTKRGQQGQPGPKGDGREGNWRGPGGADGPTQTVTGSSKFTGLPARDRAAIQQSQGESYPQEYAPLVEQYLRNLADQADPK